MTETHDSDTRSEFSLRHIGPSHEHVQEMLQTIDCESLPSLIAKAAPEPILNQESTDLPAAMSENQMLKEAKRLGKRNSLFKSYIGTGYYGTLTPNVILRNILENPGWYTAYTPYQAEISQGRMEALLNFQTIITDLTALEIANASLLDEATATAEAMTMALGINGRKNPSKDFVIDADCFPQTIEVLKTRAKPLGINLVVSDPEKHDYSATPVAGVILQYPGARGEVKDYSQLSEKVHACGGQVIVAADILSLCILKPPGEWGADIVVGSTQRFGVPMGFGGPHAGYMACKESHKRLMPGRIIGMSKDSKGRPALRLALQTREQHIRRERATSNICTAQVLLAVMSSMYAVYHGPGGLKKIAQRVHQKTSRLAESLKNLGYNIHNKSYFDTLCIHLGQGEADTLIESAQRNKINLARFDEHHIGISIDETVESGDLTELISLFARFKGRTADVPPAGRVAIPDSLLRDSEYLTHPVFNSYHSETEMLRYIHRLEVKDLTLNAAMIPLGSCTMKLNATSEMIPISWPEFSDIHPFVPLEQAEGYLDLISQLERWLSELTGFAAVSLQPNAGSQGEYAGLLVIRKYHESRGDTNRNICIIPSSAHGTNPASAIMAGMKVVVVKCDDHGNIDIEDLKQKATDNKDKLAALMVTYPSTHGVFENGIIEICDIIHDNGGQVYMDGANLNALVGLSQPGKFGPDVSHLNLHKTFCIPHGGGGPGIGPIGVGAHLKDFLPTHSVVPKCGPEQGISAVSAAPWGSASILPISWAYIAMMGEQGLRKASQVAILNANYIAKKLKDHYDILFTNPDGWVAHECIVDVRGFKDTAGVTVDDIAKRLMDFGFHAPTMSWPVAGTLMIEPTESESKIEIDRFIDAMITIREEIREIESGSADKENNVLKNAPHSLNDMITDNWEHPYTREKAAYPQDWVKQHKFWTSVSRVDNAFGDRNLVCTCPALSEYQ